MKLRKILSEFRIMHPIQLGPLYWIVRVSGFRFAVRTVVVMTTRLKSTGLPQTVTGLERVAPRQQVFKWITRGAPTLDLVGLHVTWAVS